MPSDAAKEIERFTRDKMASLLALCTMDQQKFFHRLYPGGPEKMPPEDFERAFEQIEATLKKNNRIANT